MSNWKTFANILFITSEIICIVIKQMEKDKESKKYNVEADIHEDPGIHVDFNDI